MSWVELCPPIRYVEAVTPPLPTTPLPSPIPVIVNSLGNMVFVDVLTFKMKSNLVRWALLHWLVSLGQEGNLDTETEERKPCEDRGSVRRWVYKPRKPEALPWDLTGSSARPPGFQTSGLCISEKQRLSFWAIRFVVIRYSRSRKLTKQGNSEGNNTGKKIKMLCVD